LQSIFGANKAAVGGSLHTAKTMEKVITDEGTISPAFGVQALLFNQSIFPKDNSLLISESMSPNLL
jgi:fructoselysine-6-P-deglycase FrlB-like protein